MVVSMAAPVRFDSREGCEGGSDRRTTEAARRRIGAPRGTRHLLLMRSPAVQEARQAEAFAQASVRVT